MRVFVSGEKRVPIRISTAVESRQSRTGCHDAERIRDESILAEFVDEVEKTQQQNVHFNNNAGSANLFANVDGEGFKREFFSVKDQRHDYNTSSYVDPMLDDSLDAGLFQVSNTQPEMYCNRLTGDYINKNSKPMVRSEHEMDVSVQEKSPGPSEELQLLTSQAQQQQEMILALQKQLHNLTVLYQQENRQKLLKEKEKLQKEVQVSQDSVVKETVSTRMQSENASMKNLPPLCGSHKLHSRQSEDVQPQMRQRNQKRMTTGSNVKVAADVEPTRQLRKVSRYPGQTDRIDKSEDSLPTKKQVRSNIRVKRSNFDAENHSSVRGKSKTFSCSECGKQFFWKSYLIRHFRIHTGEKPFKCGDCGVSFNEAGNLTKHRIIHSGEKPFKCGDCGVSFNRAGNLTRHRMIHSGEKPFLCDICQKSFRVKKTLSEHMDIHSGRRTHKCNVCEKTFRQRSILSRHRKVHSKEE